MYRDGENAGDPRELSEVLWEMAEAGWGLFNLLVRDPNDQRRVRDLLSVGDGIHAAHIDASTVIPWSLLYDRRVHDTKQVFDFSDAETRPYPVERAVCRASMPRPDGSIPDVRCGSAGCLLDPEENERRKSEGRPIVCEETVVCPRRFWGFMYPIEVPAQQVAGVKGSPPPTLKTTIQAGRPVNVVAGMNPHLSFARSHEQKLRLDLGDRAAVRPPPSPGRDALRQWLDQVEPDVVYLYCHAIPSMRANGKTIGPSLDFGLGHKGNADDTIVAEGFAGKAWGHAPLVFMNGCGNVGFSPYAPSEFVKQFIQGRYASAVIGTEVTVWEVLAKEIAEIFIREFVVNGKAAGDALLYARRALLAKENPLGLIYTLYGSAQLKIGTIKTDA
jgi:hypothetical protein